MNSPRHEGGGGGTRAVDPPPRGSLRGKVVGMPRHAKARVVHIMYDHNTLVSELEVRLRRCFFAVGDGDGDSRRGSRTVRERKSWCRWPLAERAGRA